MFLGYFSITQSRLNFLCFFKIHCNKCCMNVCMNLLFTRDLYFRETENVFSDRLVCSYMQVILPFPPKTYVPCFLCYLLQGIWKEHVLLTLLIIMTPSSWVSFSIVFSIFFQCKHFYAIQYQIFAYVIWMYISYFYFYKYLDIHVFL